MINSAGLTRRPSETSHGREEGGRREGGKGVAGCLGCLGGGDGRSKQLVSQAVNPCVLSSEVTRPLPSRQCNMNVVPLLGACYIHVWL